MSELRRNSVNIEVKKVGADYFTVSVGKTDSRVDVDAQTIIVNNGFKEKMDGKSIRLYGGSTTGAFDGWNFVRDDDAYTFAVTITETADKITARAATRGVFGRGTLVFMKNY